MFTQEILTKSSQLGKSQLLFYNNSVHKSSSKINLKTLRGWRRLLRKVASRFGESTSIHGGNRVFSRSTNRTERMMWSLALFFAIAMLIYVCLIIAARYRRKQLETVIDTTKYPVYKLPFPEVTICNRNRLNWSRLPQAKRQFLLSSHQTQRYEALFEDVVARFDRLAYGHFDMFDQLPQNDVLQALNYVNFTAVVRFMAWHCNEMMQECFWQGEQFNCCDAFFPRNSQMGHCLAFNSVESEQARVKARLDTYWPWRVGTYGPGSALMVRVPLRVHNHSPHSNNKKGLQFMLTEPDVWYSTPIEVAEFTQVSVSINSNVNFYDNDTRSMSPKTRGCIFDDEQTKEQFATLKDRRYTFENCQAECQRAALQRYCNCTMDVFFPWSEQTPCQLLDYSCLAKHNTDLQEFKRNAAEKTFIHASSHEGITCDCLLNCFRLLYMPDVRSTALNTVERAEHEPFVKLDLYFRRSYTLSYKTTMVFTWVDLLVSFGGIAGLFLGCSLISIFELAYFFAYDMPKCLWNEQAAEVIQRRRQKNIKNLLASNGGNF